MESLDSHMPAETLTQSSCAPAPCAPPSSVCGQTANRPKNAAATREAILAAARQRFLLESYENVGLREIAGDVGCDVALVSRYFGGKEKLFAELFAKREALVPHDVATADLPAYFTKLLMEQDTESDRAHADRLLMILRSASSPQAAAIVRAALTDDVLVPLAERLCGPDAMTRASLAMAVWMGATMMRTIMAVEPMCDGTCNVVPAKIAALYETALSATPVTSTD